MNNFAFFGTPRFAEIFLSEIVRKGVVPSLVVTNPDRPAGRKKELAPPPVKVLAEKHGIPVFQEKLETLNLKLETQEHGFGLVAAYGSIIPKSVIEIFPKGIICLHPSLLPELRGATPIQTALLEGREETGVSLFLMDEKVDHGQILSERKIAISENDDYVSLEEKLAKSGAELFIEIMPEYLSEKLSPIPQDESRATYTKKFPREAAFVPEAELKDALAGKGARQVSAKIRAFSKEPGAWTIISPGSSTSLGKLNFCNPTQVKLLACEIVEGKLKLTKIQTESKKAQIL